MYEKLDTCPVCGHPKFTNFLICTDHSITGQSFALVKCEKCTHIFTNPRPSKDEISKYYESPNYISHSKKSTGLITPLYNLAKAYTLRWKHNIISEYSEKGSVLDYGCGTGDFLAHMRKKSWQVHGIEPNKLAAETARERGIRVDSGFQKDNKAKYDIITAWHVIEHVHELKETLQNLRKRTDDSSTIFVALPNPESFDCEHYKENWAGYDVPRHLHHFTKKSLSKIISKTRLQLVDIIPMPLDAYYVSILSEKYIGSPNYILKGLLKGFTSNKKAKSTGQYSSNIFVITR